jgi:Protein of unknown function (DUF402)
VSWRAGEVVVRREVLHGHVWCGFATYVVQDTEDVLALYLPGGSELAFPAWPFDRWEHPWLTAGHRTWTGHGKLMLQRPGDPYSVDVFWTGPDRAFAGWYLNLQDPLRRGPGRIDTLDHELDYWLPAVGGWEVKDDELFEERVREERYDAEQAAAIRVTGEAIVTMLDGGTTWWDPAWAAWTPPEQWSGLRLPGGWSAP